MAVEASDAAAVVVAAVSGVGVTVLVVAAVVLARAARELRRTVEALQSEALPAVAELRRAVAGADAELDRVDRLLGTAETVGATVDSASRLAYRAVSSPVIKTMALATGTGRAARRLRKGS